ncbi:hypothetical protein KY363_03165 [Candidatus Woesearchaeota archaeon]|nr:hypothetical protein [Candidatus Woesearchaeota archaeon]
MTDEMPKAVKRDIQAVLKKAQRYINNGDNKKLKHLSDYAIQNTSIFQDKDALTLAVIIYAVSKLLERWGFEGEYPEQIRNYLSSAEFSLNEGKLDDYRDHIGKLADFISAVDKQFKLYVDKVMEKAQIKKGSSLFEHGISVARSADLIGIGQWELMSYIGKTRIHDQQEIASDVEQRLKFARSLFKK